MPLCLCAGDSRRRNSWELAQSAESKPQRLTAKYWGPRVLRPARFPHTDAALICCICCWSCWAILFCSLSFCVSANFTTMGDEQPYENTKTKGSNPSFWVKEKSLLVTHRLHSNFIHCQMSLFLIHVSGKRQFKKATSSNMLILTFI